MVAPGYASDYAVALEKAFQDVFATVTASSLLQEIPGLSEVINVVASDGDSEDYAFDIGLGAPQKVFGVSGSVVAPPIYGIGDEKYTLKNEEWVANYRIPRSTIEDDRHGFIRTQLALAPAAAKMTIVNEIATVLLDAANRLCHDGTYFFSNAHWGSQDNRDKNKLVSMTDLAASAKNASEVRAYLEAFKDKYGNYLMMRPTHVITGVGDTGQAWEFLSTSLQLPGVVNAANPWYGIRVIKLPQMTNPKWVLVSAPNEVIRPLVWQERVAPTVSVYEPSAGVSDYTVEVRFRGRVGFGPWFTAVCGDWS